MAVLNRARMTTATTGTGTVTLGSAVPGYGTFAEAGAVDATQYSYCIDDGDDFEIGVGTYTSSGTTFSRDTVTFSKIGGTAGTSKINLSGSAQIFVTALAGELTIKPPTKQIFTSSGTWTKPTGCRFIKVTVIGGGGGGAGSANASGSEVAYGTSGGAGATAVDWIDVTAISSETVTIGALGAKGAAGANNGSNGGQSSFGSHAVAGGGIGGTTVASGTSAQQSNGAAGGTATAGDVQFAGQAGGPFLRFSGTSAAMLCNGGNGNFGNGGAPPAFNASGNNGSGYGAGGSGCSSVSAGGAQAGGDGTPGLCIVEEFY